MITSIYHQFMELCATTPEIARYRRTILDGCGCQKMPDQVLQQRIETFLLSKPECRPLLANLLPS